MHGKRRAWPCAAVLLPLLLAGIAAAQNSATAPVVRCSITIRQPTAVSYTTTIDCSGDGNPDLVVVVQNATAIRNSVTYLLNGVVQQLGAANFVEDGSQLWVDWAQSPALVGMGMTATSTQQGTVVISASVVDITLPQAVVQPSIGPLTQLASVFSALRFSTISNVEIVDSVFDGITSTVGNQGYSAVVWTDDANMNPDFLTFFPAISVTNSTFSRIRGLNTQSGALMLKQMVLNTYGAVSIINSTFTGISASSSGAAMYMDIRCPGPPLDSEAPYCPSLVTVRGCRFINNNSTQGRGGAMVIYAGNVRIEDSVFINNRAASSGGALMFDSGGVNTTLDIVNTVFRDNVAGNVVGPNPLCNAFAPTAQCNVDNECGGAMRVITSMILPGAQRYWSGSATVAVTGSQFINNGNDQVNTGGAVCIGRDQTRGFTPSDIYSLPYAQGPNSTVLFHTTSFIDNYVPRERTTAGAVFDFGSQGMTFDNCTFRSNTAGRGAAIYSLWSTYLNITGNTIFEDHVNRWAFAGTIGVTDMGRSLTVDGAIFRNNSCSPSNTVPPATGGAIFMERQLAENPSLPNYTATITNTVFFNNSCQEAGAVYVRGVGHTIGPNVLFDSNRATLAGAAGGALYIDSLNDRMLMQVPIRSNIYGTTFQSNWASSNGGALYSIGIWRLDISESLFFNNSVTTAQVFSEVANAGGAAYINELFLSPLNISRTNFTSNAAYRGGALAVTNNDMTLSSCLFQGNLAGVAGALKVQASDPGYQANITNSTFTRNAAGTGGALQASSVGLVVNGSAFEANTADLRGGALVLEACAPTDSNALGRYAPAIGIEAGALANPQAVYILDSQFSDNLARTGSGGAVVASASHVVLVRSTFQDNRCLSTGGTLYGLQSAIHEYLGSYSGSRAEVGGAVMTEGCDVTFNSTLLQNNTATRGGAVFSGLAAGPPGSLLLRTSATELNKCTLVNNYATTGTSAASGIGGCLSTEGVDVIVRGGTWVNSSAPVAGGAIDARGQGNLVLQGGVVLRSSAAATGGTVSVDGLTSVTMQLTSMSDSSAPSGGGCLRVGNTPCVLLDSTLLTNCTSVSSSGGGALITLPSSRGCPADKLQSFRSSLLTSSASSGASIASALSSALLAASLPSLVSFNTTISDGQSVNGGGLALQLSPGTTALLDQATFNRCAAVPATTCTWTGTSLMNLEAGSTGSANGGGLFVTVSAASQPGTDARASGAATVIISNSVFSSNSATCGIGGAAAIVAIGALTELTVRVVNSSLTNNTAVNGGALAALGPGSLLELQSSVLAFNRAVPSPANLVNGSLGGCIYAESCQGLLLRDGAQLSDCEAVMGAGGQMTGGGGTLSGTGQSIGGGLLADGCKAVVLDNATVSGSTASAGGGVAVRDTAALLLSGATLRRNNATTTRSVVSRIERLPGVGGGLWVAGSTASLLHGSSLLQNNAGILGGGAAALTSCTPRSTSTTQVQATQVPLPLAAAYPVLSDLARRAAQGCYLMNVRSSFVADNAAQGSGGAFFGPASNSLDVATCSSFQTEDASGAGNSQPLDSVDVQAANMRGVVACPANGNIAVQGYGPVFASLPASLALDQSVTEALNQHNSASNATPTMVAVQQGARFTQDGRLVMSVTLPLVPAALSMRVSDTAGQDMQDPLLGNLISITVTANSSDAGDESSGISLYGRTVAHYDSRLRSFVFSGVGVNGQVGRSYSLSFNMTSELSGSLAQALQVGVALPDCSDGTTYVDPSAQASCSRCETGFFAFSDTSGRPARVCFPCPRGASCSGGAVLVPDSGYWHSSLKSTAVHQCQSTVACARTDERVAQLQACQAIWYGVQQLAQLGALLDDINHTIMSTLNGDGCPTAEQALSGNPYVYSDLLCADGYGGNLCGVCVTNSKGQQTTLRSQTCGACPPTWVIYIASAGMFLVNLLTIMIQVYAVLGERLLSGTMQASDCFAMIITHVQYLVVIVKLPFNWPPLVNGFNSVIGTIVSFASDAIRYASVSCLSDGSPEAQATYQMRGSLIIPAILIFTSVCIWIGAYYFRLNVWYPRLDRKAKEAARMKASQEQSDAEAALHSDPGQVAVSICVASQQQSSGKSDVHNALAASAATPDSSPVDDPSVAVPQKKSLAQAYEGPDGTPGFMSLGSSRHHATDSRATPPRTPLRTQSRQRDEEDHTAHGPSGHVVSSIRHNITQPFVRLAHAGSIRRQRLDLTHWQLPEADGVPQETLWFAPVDATEEERKLKEKDALTLAQKMQILDDYVPLWQQLLAVVVIASFVVYQGWVSAALSVFNCVVLDDGELDPNMPQSLSYYKDFQLAAAPSGYWSLNMNQACYQGVHLAQWTPIGAVMACVVGLGVPLLMFLPVFINRKRLNTAKTQLRWGSLYMPYYYGRVPYWAAAQMLELLVFIVVQTFTSSLPSVVEQAAIMLTVLLAIVAINVWMWPLVHPLLALLTFLSFMVLGITLTLSAILGDGISWELSSDAANAVGALVVAINVAYAVLAIVLYYSHMRELVQKQVKHAYLRMSTTFSSLWSKTPGSSINKGSRAESMEAS